VAEGGGGGGGEFEVWLSKSTRDIEDEKTERDGFFASNVSGMSTSFDLNPITPLFADCGKHAEMRDKRSACERPSAGRSSVRLLPVTAHDIVTAAVAIESTGASDKIRERRSARYGLSPDWPDWCRQAFYPRQTSSK